MKAGRKRDEWEPMRLVYVGVFSEILRGTPKFSIATQDPGEPSTKPRGHDH